MTEAKPSYLPGADNLFSKIYLLQFTPGVLFRDAACDERLGLLFLLHVAGGVVDGGHLGHDDRLAVAVGVGVTVCLFGSPVVVVVVMVTVAVARSHQRKALRTF